VSFQGVSFGADKNVSGEVVFNTAMTGYVEALTDPSYKGQILVLTYPIQGNYGVTNTTFESEKIQVQGLIVANYNENYSHFMAESSLGKWLKDNGVPALTGIDTRTLTKVLRESGTLTGKILTNNNEQLDSVNMQNVLDLVVDNRISHYKSQKNNPVDILLVDTGVKLNIIRLLQEKGTNVIRAPWNMDWENYLEKVDGVLLANGPGNPNNMGFLVDKIKNYLFNIDIPIFGICLGHQLLSLASGANIVKLKYGNRSVNQPVKDLQNNKCYITSQNHGFAVDVKTLNSEWDEWFINLNDNSNEGIKHKFKPISSVQFHPEAANGSKDTNFLFDDYINTIREKINTNE